MRILHIFDHSLPLQSGYVFRSASIIRGQQARGWETIHLTTPRHPATKDICEMVDGLSFYRTANVNISVPVLRELMEMKATRRRLSEVVRAERPDLLHAHSPVLNAIPVIAVGRKFGLPVVYEVRALWEDAAVDLRRTREGGLRYLASRWLETWAMRRADWVVALCDPLRDEIAARGIARERITVVPNAVDAAFLDSVVAPDPSLRERLGIVGGPVLGFIGSFYSYEGLDLLIEAVPQLLKQMPQLRVLLVGGGPEEGRLRRMVNDAGLDHVVRFAGRVPHEDVARHYALIDIFVFPRRRMRLTELVTPLKPLEAMAQDKPVVASDVGGHRELIRDADTGYLFAADSAAALAERLRAVIENATDRGRVAANGRRFVQQERTWDVVVGRYATIYKRLLSGRRTTGQADRV